MYVSGWLNLSARHVFVFVVCLFVCLPIVLFFRRKIYVRKRVKCNCFQMWQKGRQLKQKFASYFAHVIIKLSLQSRRVHRNVRLQYKEMNPNISDTKIYLCISPAAQMIRFLYYIITLFFFSFLINGTTCF